MGRIKTKAIKAVTEDLIRDHLDEFTDEYEQNKIVVEKYADIPSKKLRNIIAGYATRLARSREEI